MCYYNTAANKLHKRTNLIYAKLSIRMKELPITGFFRKGFFRTEQRLYSGGLFSRFNISKIYIQEAFPDIFLI